MPELWLMLVNSVSGENKTARMRIWRALKASGPWHYATACICCRNPRAPEQYLSNNRKKSSQPAVWRTSSHSTPMTMRSNASSSAYSIAVPTMPSSSGG